MLKSRAFTTWEQRPYLFRFKNYRPITGNAEFMYQNVTFIPLVAANGEVDFVGVVVYDVTDIAVSKIELEAANKQLEVLSRTDRLTQLYNRGYWEECLVREFRRSRRTGGPTTLIMFDIDHFKKVNDTHGHPAGDEVIRNTSAMLRQAARATDVCGRYGGEEFGVILIETGIEGAMVFAERLRAAIEACVVRHDQTEIRYTISLGVAELRPGMETHKQWIECSDQGLYNAKRGGRNRAVAYDGKSEPGKS
jgi:diguanylate cyclase (GGDEF)-like protein